jgi:signal transduction histidine kinase
MNLVVSIRVVRPVRALATAARHVAGGAYEARVPAEGVDEIGALARAFNEMAASLETSERRRRELLSDVAHELRTPVATIAGYVEGIVDGVVDANADVLETLKAETLRLGRLVDDLQKVSRAEERQLDLKLVAIRPEVLLDAAVQAAAPSFAAKGVLLERQAEPRLPAIALDPDRLGEVLANLLENALRHTPPGGRVGLEAVRRGDRIELSVSDDGDGIPAEHLDRIFERFYRVDRSRSRAEGGSGIGLAIARAIVGAHGGTIHAESDGEGRGARFVISLPVSSVRPAGD